MLSVLELLSRENQALLIRRDPLLVLNLRLHVVDGIGRLHIEGDGLAGERLYEDLHRGGAACGVCRVDVVRWQVCGDFQALETCTFNRTIYHDM